MIFCIVKGRVGFYSLGPGVICIRCGNFAAKWISQIIRIVGNRFQLIAYFLGQSKQAKGEQTWFALFSAIKMPLDPYLALSAYVSNSSWDTK